jgi:hypothetical protein
MKRMVYATAILLVVALIAGVVLAAGGPERLRQVLSAGGTNAGAGGLILYGTLGQPVAGRTTGDGAVVIGQGLWSSGGPASYPVYLPVVLRQ